MPNVRVGLDSGAYSVGTGAVRKELLSKESYADYLKREGHRYDFGFNFDVMRNGPASYENWLWLRKQGLDVVPVFHVGTPEKFLEKYLKRTEFIALSLPPGVRIRAGGRKDLTYIWNKYLLKDGKPLPGYRFHGLGMTSAQLMFGYPWYSVDSASAVMAGGYGMVWMPHTLVEEDGKLIEGPRTTFPWWMTVSLSVRKGVNTKANGSTKSRGSFYGWPSEVQQRYETYMNHHGFTVGRIRVEDVDKKKINRRSETAMCIECPTCKAPVLRPCKEDGGNLKGRIHEERITAGIPTWRACFKVDCPVCKAHKGNHCMMVRKGQVHRDKRAPLHKERILLGTQLASRMGVHQFTDQRLFDPSIGIYQPLAVTQLETEEKYLDLSSNWVMMTIWNMLYMKRIADRINGPKIYFVSNPDLCRGLVRHNMVEQFLQLLTYARRDEFLNTFWRYAHGSQPIRT